MHTLNFPHPFWSQEPQTLLLPASSSHPGPATSVLFVQGVTPGVQFPSATIKALSPALRVEVGQGWV